MDIQQILPGVAQVVKIWSIDTLNNGYPYLTGTPPSS